MTILLCVELPQAKKSHLRSSDTYMCTLSKLRLQAGETEETEALLNQLENLSILSYLLFP